ncbi:coiled-coil domain-containing protein 22 homolog [Rhopilema esculentum]|uniref:coiled-coil domain-containing protein 22 homolog n=1 Tax=Rhopilema esculentum TaxID=499914 RepID=UPI0031D7459C
MEEVDKIIIHSLRQVGCEIPQELQTIREFTANLVIEAASRCLNLINEGANLPTSLPGSMSARFRIGAGLAAACQDLGYPGEIGYQTFLYSNEHELRKVIMFLIEKLPKDTSEVEDEPLGASVLLNQRIAAEIKRQMSITWMPAYCTDRNIVWQGSKPRLWHSLGTSSHFAPNSAILNAPKGLGDIEKKLPKDLKLYYDKHLPLVIDQVPQERDVAFSLLSMNTAMNVAAAEWESEWNQAGLSSRLSEQEYKKQKKEKLMKKMKEEMQKVVQKSDGTPTPSSQDLSELLASMAGSDSKSQVKGSRFTHAEKLQFAQDDEKIVTDASQQKVKDEEETEEEKQQKREEEISSLKSQFQEMTSQIEKLHLEIKQTQANSNHVKELEQASDTKSKDLEDSYRVKKRTIDLLPDAENNIVKLEQLVENSTQRLLNLASQWETHRAPLIVQYRELKAANESKVSEIELKINEIKNLREKMKSAADEAKTKEDLHKQLVAEYERMAKDVNRSAYTKRILEIVANINRQKNDINNVLKDTRALQKDINFLSGKLERTFTETDELIFKDAKKNEFSRKAYKLLANLHENFADLVKSVEETGSIMREIRELEDQLDNLNEKEIKENLEQITKDLKEMKQENSVALKKLKSDE